MTMEKDGVLYIEDAVHVVCHLLDIYKVPESFVTTSFEGKGNYGKTLETAMKSAHFNKTILGKKCDFDIHRLGIVVDANGNLNDTFDEFKRIVTSYRCSCPDSLSEDGLVLKNDGYGIEKIGIWIMPDNVNPGMLEDFYQHFITDDDKLIPEVDAFINGLPEKDLDSPKPRSKARMRTWLACQKKSEALMGYFLSENKDRLNVRNAHAERFVSWIKRLFID